MAYFIKTDMSRAIAIVWDNSRKLCKTIIGHAFFRSQQIFRVGCFHVPGVQVCSQLEHPWQKFRHNMTGQVLFSYHLVFHLMFHTLLLPCHV